MKRLSFILLALIAFGTMAWAQQTTYQRVTSGLTDWSGNYVMAVPQNSTTAFAFQNLEGVHNDTIGDFNVGRITSVPLENDIITSSDDAAVLTIEKSTDPVYYGYYTIRIKGGDYLYIDTKKLLGTTSEITQDTYWNIIYTSNGIKFTKYKWEPIINLYLITFLDSASQPNGFFSLDDGTIYQDYNGYHFIYYLPYLYKETSDGNITCEEFESYNYISEVTHSGSGVTPSEYLPTDWKGYGSLFYPFVANFTFVSTQEDNFIHFMAKEGNDCFLALPYEHVTEVVLDYAYLTAAQGTLEVGYMTDISGASWYDNTYTNVMTLSNQNNYWQSETVDFSNISANTYYVVFKFSENSDTGARAAIDNVCVTTSLPPYDKTIPYTYGFEDEGDYSSWSTENCEICFEETNRYGRYYDPSQAHTGSYSFAFTSFCYETDPQYLISPKLDGVVDGVHVEFYYCNLSTSPETFEVGYSTTDNNVNSFTWVDSRTNTTTNYQQFKANYMNDVKYVAVKYSSVYSHYLLLDDFTIQEAPSCLEPTNVMASNETITSATISWTAGGSENEWDLYFTSNSSDVPTASTAPSFSGLSTNTYDLTDLAPATTYYVYVRAACNETEKSDWSTPCSFNTECQSLTLPYSYGFEDEILSVCWNILISDHVYMEAGLSDKAPYQGNGHLALFRGTPDLEDYQIVVLPEAAPSYALSNYEVSFFARLHDGGDSDFTTSGRTLAVGIMTDPMDPSTFVQVGDIISPTNTYQQCTVNLSSYTGDGQYIAIKHFSTENNAGYTLIDDVEVKALSCYVPDGLNATAAAASASLGWHGDQSNYNVRYRTITVGEEAETITEDFSDYTAHDYNITSGGDRPSDWAYYTNNNTYVSPHVSSNDALSSNYAISGMNDQGNFLYMLMTTYAVMPRIENLTSFSFKFAFDNGLLGGSIFYMGYVTDATNITGTFNILSNHSYQATTTLTTVTLTSEDLNTLNNTYGARIAFRFECYSGSSSFGIDDIVYTTYPITYGEWENANNQISPLAISGLTPATNYQWQVQGIEVGCSDGEGNDDVTKWSKMATFTTLGCVKPIEAYSSNQDGWNLIASPIGTVSIEDVINLCSNTYDLYRFNQAADKEWENYKATENGQLLHPDFTSLVSGKGYLYANSQDVTLEFVGLPYNEAGSVTLEYSTDNSNENMHGWNLIGNPFATEATLDKPFFRMNEGGTALTAQVEAGNTVAAMEGVFVQATQEGQTALFTQVNNRGGEKSEVPMINVNLIRNRGEVLSNAIVRFDNGETLGAFSLREDDSKIYITQDGKDYAVARSNGEGELPVSFKAKENGTYTISVNTEGLELDYLHLIDNMTGADVDLLATSSYTFTAKTTDYESRFKLVFAVKDGPSTGSGTFAFISDGNIIINGEGTLQVMDVMGRIIVCRDAMHCISTTRMAPGVYVLRLIDGNDVKTQKIVIK